METRRIICHNPNRYNRWISEQINSSQENAKG